MLPVRKTRLIFGLIILILSLAGLLAAFTLVKKPKKETPSQAAGGTADFWVETGEEEYVMGPTNLFDTIFHSIPTASGIRAYIAERDTYTLFGNNLNNLVNQGKSLERGQSGQFDECGAWLNSAYKIDENHFWGWYHAEAGNNCDYSQNTELLRKSMGFTESFDGGRTWTKPNYPNNQILTAESSLLSDAKKDDAGDGRIIKIGNYFYMFYIAGVDWKVHLARASVGTPSIWQKYYQGNFSEPGIGGKSSPISDNLLGRSVVYNSYLGRYISPLISGRWGFNLSFSETNNYLAWNQFPSLFYPLVSYTTDSRVDNWANRDGQKQLYAYESFIAPNGESNSTGQDFYLYYMKLFDGEDFSQRYLLRRKISLHKLSESPFPYSAVVALTRYEKTTPTKKTRVSTEIAKPVEGYQKKTNLGYLLPYEQTGFRPLYECYIPLSNWDDYFISIADPGARNWEHCESDGDKFIRKIGYASTTKTAQANSPLYHCFDEPNLDHFLSADPNCEGKQNNGLLGYAFSSLPSSQAADSFSVTVRKSGQEASAASLETNLHQNEAYILRFHNMDGSPYNDSLEVTMKTGESSSYSSPSLFKDSNGNLLKPVNGDLTIDLKNWRNSQTGEWLKLGKYFAKFRPAGQDISFSNEIVINVVPYEIADYWPFPPPGSYFEYQEIPGISPTRFRFDIEKYVNLCGNSSLPVFRMTQTNRLNNLRFMGQKYSFRFILEWINNHLHSTGIKFYNYFPTETEPNALSVRGKLSNFMFINTYSKQGYSAENLPSFYLIPKYLDLNFFKNDAFKSGGNCETFNNSYAWAIDIRILDQNDLNTGAGPGNLQPGDIQIRFIEHDNAQVNVSLNREDWFLRKNFGIIRVESSRDKFTEECVNNQHSNFTCWPNSSLSADAPCNCWSRRIHPQNLTEGFVLIQSYQPKKLNFVIKENNSKEYQLTPGSFYTIKETASNYTGFLAEAGNPSKIWQAFDENGNLKDVWLENGEAKIYIPSSFPTGIYNGSFRSWIWSKPEGETVGGETTIEPSYPSWSDPIRITVASSSPTSTPMPTPSTGANLNFQIKFQGILGQGPDKTARVILKQNGVEKYRFESVAVNSDSAGVYSGNSPEITPGTYEVFIKGPAHLQKNFAGVTINSGMPIQDWTATPLLAGDVWSQPDGLYHDNKITTEDVISVLNMWTDFTVGVPANTLQDLNGDNKITDEDIRLLLVNYNSPIIYGQE